MRYTLKNSKGMKQQIWEYWKTVCGTICITVPVLILIFGGKVDIEITWNTAKELYKTIIK